VYDTAVVHENPVLAGYSLCKYISTNKLKIYHHHSDDGVSMYIWNVGLLPQDHKVIHPRKLSSSTSHLLCTVSYRNSPKELIARSRGAWFRHIIPRPYNSPEFSWWHILEQNRKWWRQDIYDIYIYNVNSNAYIYNPRGFFGGERS
jgi:hypothetical protein